MAKAKKAGRRDRSAAVVSVVNAAGMTRKGRRDVAEWLREQAHMLIKDGPKYTSGRFVARYMYTPGVTC